jgi:hypothetical protein
VCSLETSKQIRFRSTDCSMAFCYLSVVYGVGWYFLIAPQWRERKGSLFEHQILQWFVSQGRWNELKC